MKLYGRNPVLERLRTNPRSIQKIYLAQGHRDGAYIRKKAARWGLTVIVVPASRLVKLARNVNVQGVLAEIEGFAYADFRELLEPAPAKRPALVFLDGVTDPQNLGAMIRSLGGLGGFALVLPTHRSAGVTEVVLRVACGGENFMRIAQVKNLATAVMAAREAGFWIAATVVSGGTPLPEAELNFPLGLIVGSEDKGVRDIVKKHADRLLSIPMAHPRMSLNVAQAATLLAYEVVRRRRGKGER